MKTITFESTNEIFNGFAMLNEEMIKVRGGDGGLEPTVKPTPPPIAL